MEEFVISNNHFEGLLVSGRCGVGATNLRVIKFDRNWLVGSNTALFFAYVPNLEVLNVTGNLHEEGVASELGLCPKLSYIGLGSANYFGTLPTEL